MSVGFLISDDDNEKRLAISVASRQGVVEQVAGVIAIPARCVARWGRLITSSSVCPSSDPAAELAQNQPTSESAAS
jgi:hypothetical protein